MRVKEKTKELTKVGSNHRSPKTTVKAIIIVTVIELRVAYT